jgi:hypothetical protein
MMGLQPFVFETGDYGDDLNNPSSSRTEPFCCGAHVFICVGGGALCCAGRQQQPRLRLGGKVAAITGSNASPDQNRRSMHEELRVHLSPLSSLWKPTVVLPKEIRGLHE